MFPVVAVADGALAAGLPVHIPEHVPRRGKHAVYRHADAVDDCPHV
jgi:hypothetical protein